MGEKYEFFVSLLRIEDLHFRLFIRSKIYIFVCLFDTIELIPRFILVEYQGQSELSAFRGRFVA